ncbi:MAG: ribbon-helix-helix protein, CopG family [Acidimicrobiales bacterium]
MRTTVSIDDHLLAAARDRAQARGQTLSQILEDALRSELVRDAGGERPKVPVFTAGTGARPGIDLSSNRAIHAVLDEEKGLDELR